jgi:hypothetical protein
LPLLLALLMMLAAGIGGALRPFVRIQSIVAGISTVTLAVMLVLAAAMLFLRRMRS